MIKLSTEQMEFLEYIQRMIRVAEKIDIVRIRYDLLIQDVGRCYGLSEMEMNQVFDEIERITINI
jgi:hypothetical protein